MARPKNQPAQQSSALLRLRDSAVAHGFLPTVLFFAALFFVIGLLIYPILRFVVGDVTHGFVRFLILLAGLALVLGVLRARPYRGA